MVKTRLNTSPTWTANKVDNRGRNKMLKIRKKGLWLEHSYCLGNYSNNSSVADENSSLIPVPKIRITYPWSKSGKFLIIKVEDFILGYSTYVKV